MGWDGTYVEGVAGEGSPAVVVLCWASLVTRVAGGMDGRTAQHLILVSLSLQVKRLWRHACMNVRHAQRHIHGNCMRKWTYTTEHKLRNCMRPQSFSLSLSLTNAQGSTELCKQVNHDPPRGEQIDFWRRFKGIHYKDSWAGLKELLLSGEETLGASSLRNESRRRKQPRVTPITTETSSHTDRKSVV